MSKTNHTTEDEQLVARIADRDQAAFANLYDIYGTNVYSLLRYITDESDADTLLSDVFIQVWEKATLFHSDNTKFDTWLFTLAHNTVLYHERSSGMRHANTQRDPLQWTAEFLRDDDRAVIEQAYYRGRTQKEIAVHLGIAVEEVGTHMYRGMIALADIESTDTKNESLASAYVLGSLADDDERVAAFQSLVAAGSPRFGAMLEKLLDAAAALALAVPQVSAPTSIKNSLIERIKKLAASESTYLETGTQTIATLEKKLKVRTRTLLLVSLIASIGLVILTALLIEKSAFLTSRDVAVKLLTSQRDSLIYIMQKDSLRVK